MSAQDKQVASPSRRSGRAHVLVRCRHCRVQNRLFRMKIRDPLRAPKCGSCGGFLLLTEEPLLNLSGSAYQHQLDRETLQALHKIPGVDSFLRKLVSESFERASRMLHFSSFLHCGPRQAPRMYEIFREAARRLDISTVPDLFLLHQDEWNAYTSGVKQPFVAISSGLVEELKDEELMVIFAHELGHWQSDHVLYKMAGRLLSHTAGSFIAGTFGLGSLAIIPLKLALLKWDRCAELTADRAALLAVRDPQIVLQTMMKLAGGSSYLSSQLSMDAFLEQVEQVQTMEKEHLLNRIFSVLQELFQTHPVPIWRTAELVSWIEEGQYLTILSGNDQAQKETPASPAQPIESPNEPEPTKTHPDQTSENPIIEQVRDLGQGVFNDVQEAFQQSGSLLKQLFGEKESKDANKTKKSQ